MNDETRAALVDYVTGDLNFVNSEGMYSMANIRVRAERIVDKVLEAAIGLHGDGTDVLIRCTHCNREGTAKADIGIRGNKMPDGWEQREIIDPITGTELVRKWEAVLCPDCAKKEPSHD